MDDSQTTGMAILRRIREVIDEQAAELTRLDAAIGDGDHGTNMARGFNAVIDKVESQEDQSLSALLKTAGTTLVSTVGGAAGPLYGTAFMRAASALEGVEEIQGPDVSAAMEAALEGVEARGKATPGEKTMVDALQPAVEALRIAIADNEDISTALERAAAAAKIGMESTVAMPATKGRASYLGERSIGHQDPGATSTYLILQSIAETVRERAGD